MELTHLDEKGHARMVDVSQKQITVREAEAVGCIYLQPETLARITDGSIPKGDVLSAARIASIMAVKHTWEMIPLCHQIPLDSIQVELSPDQNKSCISIRTIVRCTWKTGVEMEALTGVSVAALTVYDMCKAVDKTMVISEIKLIRKTGGNSGDIHEGMENYGKSDRD